MGKIRRTRIVGDAACPQCTENGRDSTGNHLMIFVDGSSKCNRCGYHEGVGTHSDKATEEPQKRSKRRSLRGNDSISWIGELTSTKLLSRGIITDVARLAGVRVKFSESTGEEESYFYPITKNGKIRNYRERRLPKKFMNHGPPMEGVAIDLFGQSICRTTGKKLLVVEGQDDWLAAYQMMITKYPKYPPAIVSIMGSSIKPIEDNLSFFMGFKEVVLCFDADVAGDKATEKAVKLLGDKCRVMKLPPGEDPNSMLKKRKSEEFIDSFFSAQKYTPGGVVIGGIGRDVLKQPLKKGVMVNTLPKTSEIIKGFRDAELTLVLAPAGVGKTTIVREVGYAFNKMHHKIVNIFLEEQLKKSQQGYIALDNNISLARYRQNPSLVSDEDFNRSYDELIQSQMWVDHWGSMAPEKVMDTLRYASAWGATFGILDHVSMVFSGSETVNERKDIDMLLTNMAAFTKESGMHLLVVSHIKRQDHRYKPKEFPYWETVASDAGRGSGAFEQLADNIICLEIEYLDEDMNRGKVRTRVAKNREWSRLGVGDVLGYDPDTGRILPESRELVKNRRKQRR